MPEITIPSVRDAINVPEANELPDDAVESGILRAVPRVNNRLRGGHHVTDLDRRPDSCHQGASGRDRRHDENATGRKVPAVAGHR